MQKREPSRRRESSGGFVVEHSRCSYGRAATRGEFSATPGDARRKNIVERNDEEPDDWHRRLGIVSWLGGGLGSRRFLGLGKFLNLGMFPGLGVVLCGAITITSGDWW